MYEDKKYTMDDAVRMGFTKEQFNRMVTKIERMPRINTFDIGPVGCKPEQKRQFRLEKRKQFNQVLGNYIQYAIYSPEDGHRYVFAKSSEECVLGILKMIDHWDTYFPAPEEPEKPQGTFSKMLHTIAAVFFHP
jgi:hypothetical protein